MSEADPSGAFLALADLPRRDLVARMIRGRQPDRDILAGWEYRGINTAGWAHLAGVDRFVKGFEGDYGYNRRVQRGSRTEPWLREGLPDPNPFAFFGVGPVDPTTRDNRYLDALMLDYGRFARSPLDPAGRIRDYLVATDDGPDLLIGHAFFAAGRFRAEATFFVLEPLRQCPGRTPAPDHA
ncbi:MAG: hypothetical protein ACR2ME_05865 [Acidimicrobiia bacterium]